MSKIETCSIFNARSGKCSEDCKWCAQSRFSTSEIDTYAIADHKKMVDEGETNPQAKIRLCAGRKRVQYMLPKLFDMGIKAIMTGDFLTTMGSSKKNDMKMLFSISIQ